MDYNYQPIIQLFLQFQHTMIYNHHSQCLTSSDNRLFISGGYVDPNILPTTQIFDISLQQWLKNIPSMQTARWKHGCIYDPTNNELWAVGGSDIAGALISKSVEKLSLDDPQSWTYSNNLAQNVYMMVVTIYQNYILVIGGYDGSTVRNEIQVINMGNVFIAGHLNYGVSGAGAALVGDVEYLFGGDNGGQHVNTWQYSDLLSDELMTNFIMLHINNCSLTQ